VKALFLAYRVLATVVGLSIITLLLIGVPLKYSWTWFPNLWPGQLYEGAPLQELGAHINLVLGTAHGFIYLGFLLVALALAQRERWPISFTIVTLLCGTIPVLSFWAELRAVRRVQAKHPELTRHPVTA
jgi:integral membrane protein